jgi:two-component system, NtrC family, response regulator GlrR
MQHHHDSEALTKLIGRAPNFLKVIEQIPRVARSEAAVLISGETGTGKELVARAIHYLSGRAPFPFVALNCGSLPDTLLEDELFGHERGAFTNAHVRREGLIAQAGKGTLFLDEVDTLPSKAQVDLLRVLQEKRFRSIGSGQEQVSDARIVAATNASLDQLLQAGRFRQDLYYRLSVFCIHLPPLRERKDDIPALAAHFLKKHAPADKARLKLLPSACAALLSFDWPGNVRQLESAIIRGIHLTQTDSIHVEDLGLPLSVDTFDAPAPLNAHAPRSFKAAKRDVVEGFERNYLIQLLSEHSGNVSRAARTAGKERRDLGRLIKKYQLNPKVFAPPVGRSR